MNKKELTKRYLLFIISLFFSALGVAFTKHGELGVSPTSSIANVISCKYTFWSLGTLLIVWNCILILGQILILRKNFQLIQLLQIPLSFLFGWFTDFGMWIVSYYSGKFLRHAAFYGDNWCHYPRIRHCSFCYCRCHFKFR